ncbi:hypothetical protein BDY19DRAFT_996157 [Irpex rosettiformis]|uniref:Uncharacterized protein n=1 Tax=Irpex rosettiformis TaxID=378272 RepID=A0ACB8TWP7_9APHY|nr:hypothetical protein BDY19DRAFT_996157 [Irpex rosettiformis]
MQPYTETEISVSKPKDTFDAPSVYTLSQPTLPYPNPYTFPPPNCRRPPRPRPAHHLGIKLAKLHHSSSSTVIKLSPNNTNNDEDEEKEEGVKVVNVLNYPDTFKLAEGDVQCLPISSRDDKGLDTPIKYRINWPGYDEWERCASPGSGIVSIRDLRDCTRRHLAYALGELVVDFYNESLFSRSFDRDDAKSLSWNMVFHYPWNILLHRLRCVGEGVWEVVVSSDSGEVV